MKTNKLLPHRSLLNVLTLGFIIVVLSQCTVMSFYPLYTKNELVKDDRIMGTWMSRLITEEVSKDSLVWEISLFGKNVKTENQKSPQNKTYWLKLYPSENPKDVVEFKIHIVHLKNEYYLDFLLEEMPYENIFAIIHLMPVHTFAKLEFNENELTVKWFNSELLEDLLKTQKIRIKHEKRMDGAQLLTAKPKELQEFIINYSNHADAYLKELSFNLTPYAKNS
ncbi:MULTISPECIES: hypothetical protein [unclassified Saccharicrinis]|uniref:hypothetical protein n=1 Tax=unclassified Saccharicrinis TaxID=2646859 RepID=UPI003D34B885